MPFSASHSFTAMAAAAEPAPNRLWPQPWPACVLRTGCLTGTAVLRQAGQGVVFAENADDRRAAAGLRAEGGGDVADVLGDRKTGGLQLILKQRGALRFLIADLGELPDLLRHLRPMLRTLVEPLEEHGAVHFGQLTAGRGCCEQREKCRERRENSAAEHSRCRKCRRRGMNRHQPNRPARQVKLRRRFSICSQCRR